MNLLDQLTRQATDPAVARIQVATVVAVGESARTVDVDVIGSLVAAIPVASSYGATPAVGDVALILKAGASWVAIAYLPRVPAAGDSLFADPGFEEAAVGQTAGALPAWDDTLVINGGTFVYVTADARAGVRALKSTLAKTKEVYVFPTRAASVTEGSTYRIGFWAKSSQAPVPGYSVRLEVWGDASDQDAMPSATYRDSTLVATPGASWTFYSGTYTIPPGVTFVRAALVWTGYFATTTATPTLTVDDLVFREL